MPTLRQIQQLLTADILAYGRRQPTSDGALAALLALPDGIDPETRIDVYRNGFPARIIESIEQAFPAIANILGDGSFANLVRRYLAAVELSSYNLNDVGEAFADYCRRDILTEELPLLPDLADLEWSVSCAFHAHETKAVDAASLSALTLEDWERAKLSFQESVHLTESAWPIHDLWITRDQDRAEINVDLVSRPQAVLVYRRGYEVECRRATDTERNALAPLLAGSTLGETVELLSNAGQSADETMRIFATWVQSGLITHVGCRAD